MSLNERINSTLLNLVALNQNGSVQRRVSIHSTRNKNIRYSAHMSYFSPNPNQIEHYIDLTSEIKNVIEKHDKYNSFHSMSSHLSGSRPDSISLKYCGINKCFCLQKTSKVNEPKLRQKKTRNIEVSRHESNDKIMNNKVNLSYG